jgi:hypothetical protein
VDQPHKPSKVAVAKREEMVWYLRPAKTGKNASENVNECSFIGRIVLGSFIGEVLSHMIAFNAVSNSNLYYKRKSRS